MNNKKFLSLRGLTEGEMEKKLKDDGYYRCRVPFNLGSSAVTPAILPNGKELFKETLMIDYSFINPENYTLGECYAIFVKFPFDSE